MKQSVTLNKVLPMLIPRKSPIKQQKNISEEKK